MPQSHNLWHILYAMNAFGERVKQRMDYLGVTQTELAEAIGVGQSQVSRILKGDRSTDVDVIKKIARALREDPGEYVLLFAQLPLPQSINKNLVGEAQRLYDEIQTEEGKDAAISMLEGLARRREKRLREQEKKQRAKDDKKSGKAQVNAGA